MDPHAEIRPGLVAPEPQSREPEKSNRHQTDDAIRAALELKRVCRYFRLDAAWPRIRDDLRIAELQVMHGNHSGDLERLRMIRELLGRKYA